jgi:hypothetical protein
MQMHRQVGRELQYPWRYGPQALENFRFYARLHTQLFPYVNSYAKQAGTTGLAIIRPLVLMAQDDPNVWGVRHVYHYGDEILVAPVVEPNATARNVYLPAGAWFDFWTRQRHAGRQTIAWTDADPTHLPLFVREGGIVPLLRDDADTLCDADYVTDPGVRAMTPDLHVMAFPAAAPSEFTLFDGDLLRCSRPDGGAALLTITARKRAFMLEIQANTRPGSVVRDGAALAAVDTVAALAAAASGWRFDAPSRSVFVKFGHAGGTTSIRL